MTQSRHGAVDLVVLLHGVGSSGADIARLAETWGPRLPAIAFAAPDGTQPFDGGGAGRQWFSVRGVDAANRPARVAAAAPAFDAVIDRLIAEHGTTAARTVLVGFSQGTIMALDALARGRAFAGVLGLSGRLASAATPVDLAPTPVLLVHGDRDTVMPLGEMPHAAEALRAAGCRVETREIAGMGHEIGLSAVRLGLDFIAGLASPTEG